MNPAPSTLRVAVIGHVEHITLGRAPAVPVAGEIVHIETPRVFPGGGGGIAFFQLCASPAEVMLFSAIGNDDAAAMIARRLALTRAKMHLARRDTAHTRDVVMVTPDGERTIVVVGRPLHPVRADALPWEQLAACDAVYFTAEDPEALRAARAARFLVVSARRREALDRSGVRADVVVGSANDPRESAARGAYAMPPTALVLTEGARGGSVASERGIERFAAPAGVVVRGGAYGAGDSFAGALTFYLARGEPVLDACARAAEHGAAVLAGLDPLEHQRACT